MPRYDLAVEKREQRRTGSLSRQSAHLCIALVGNPNTGKTSLFNALTGLRARTANFPGTTVEGKTGRFQLGDKLVELVDLPGMYSLKAVTPDERVARDILTGSLAGMPKPDGVIIVVDADNLSRNLFLLSQVRELRLPVVVALNMMDIARRHGIQVDAAALSRELNCPVVETVARTGVGIDLLKREIEALVVAGRKKLPVFAVALDSHPCVAKCASCPGCAFHTRFAWTESVTEKCVTAPRVLPGRKTEWADGWLTRPSIGLPVFLLVMLAVFYLIFSAASIPMELIDGLFTKAGVWASQVIPEGDFQSLVVHGIIGGVGGILVFLPQICILFFFLGILEDSGYLPRAAFVMDRLMRRIGLPGTAFVPLLSAHACAIPAIMATRVISDRRDRLVTILVAPLMTCSARIPVYAMVTALLFPNEPGKAAMVFTGAYALGIVAALVMAFVFKMTILRGASRPLVLELPGYRIPGMKTILLYTLDRAKVFVKQAGTIILVMSVLLWVFATYPKSPPSAESNTLRADAESALAVGDADQAAALTMQAEVLTARESLSHSLAGRMGRFIEPVIRPLGFDWQIGIGVLSSFAAREVIVSTLSIVYGVGQDVADQDAEGFYDTLRRAQRQDGSPVFDTATSLSLLVFYVLAMQCLPTQAVTRRETGSWKWPLLQLGYMTVLAYGAALLVHKIARALVG